MTLTYRDLIPVSELHNRGKQATVDLARLAEIRPEQHILDVGCGIGGPARTLAAEFGCRVTGIDISDEFCSAARSLNELVGLSDKIFIRTADALALPFEDESFDIVWTQHASMNIAAKQSPLHRDAPGPPTRWQSSPFTTSWQAPRSLFTSPSPGPRTHP